MNNISLKSLSAIKWFMLLHVCVLVAVMNVQHPTTESASSSFLLITTSVMSSSRITYQDSNQIHESVVFSIWRHLYC